MTTSKPLRPLGTPRYLGKGTGKDQGLAFVELDGVRYVLDIVDGDVRAVGHLVSGRVIKSARVAEYLTAWWRARARKGGASGRRKVGHSCGLRLLPEKRRRGRAGGASAAEKEAWFGAQPTTPVRFTEVCQRAVFKTWKPREIARLPYQHVREENELAKVLRAIIGVDMTVREHIIAIGVDKNNRIVSIADGTSDEVSLCSFSAVELFGHLLSPTPRGIVTGVFIGHNHPGQNPAASDHDLATTRNLTCSFQVATIVDHVIVTLDKHKSLRDYDKDGKMFPESHCHNPRMDVSDP